MIYFSIEKTIIPVGVLAFQCPHCERKLSQGVVVDRQERLLLLHFLPLYVHHTTWVTCESCGCEILSNVRPDELLNRDPEEIELGELLNTQRSGGRFLAIASMVLAVFPGLGLMIAGLAWLENRKSWGWPKTVSTIGLWLSSVVTGAAVLWMIRGAVFRWK